LSVVQTRLDEKDIKTLDDLARIKGTSRSHEIREAVKMYLANYTGEPNIRDIEKRVRKLESKINELEARLNALQP